ncbi:ExeA family protein, partial [Sphingomonas bacterium]|uniref:ExeA family protein n=1 Tax=Sphingomonas bacterium TaxID=1895847 RepID=UPI001576B719
TLLIVDEAQALPVSALEELRMLSNFQAGGHALLQIVLLGQPEFRAALHGSQGLEQLRQRVIAIHHLEPMAAGEVAAYVRHRLGVVGWTGRPAFADSAFAALHRLTDGVPRRLNQLCNRVMLHAAIERIETITAATVDLVAADLFADLPTMGTGAADLPVAPLAIEPVVMPQPAVEAASLEQAAEPSSPMVEEAEKVAAPEPRPFRHSWLALDADAAPAAASLPEAELPVVEDAVAEPIDEPEPVVDTPTPETSTPDPVLSDRLADLEARMEEQDAALRRVLTLLVDWVETDQAPKAAPIEEPRGYVPIRGAAA